MLAIAPADFQYQDTYFVVAHFHYVLVPGAIFGIFASAYYWLPKWTGHMYDETLGKLHFWLSFIGMNMAVLPDALRGTGRHAAADSGLQPAVRRLQHGLVDRRVHVRRHADLLPVHRDQDDPRRPASTGQTWDGAEGLEWSIPSPAPYHTFTTPPEVK